MSNIANAGEADKLKLKWTARWFIRLKLNALSAFIINDDSRVNYFLRKLLLLKLIQLNCLR